MSENDKIYYWEDINDELYKRKNTYTFNLRSNVEKCIINLKMCGIIINIYYIQNEKKGYIKNEDYLILQAVLPKKK